MSRDIIISGIQGIVVALVLALLTLSFWSDIKRNHLQEDLNNEVKRILVLSPNDSLIKLGPLTGKASTNESPK